MVMRTNVTFHVLSFTELKPDLATCNQNTCPFYKRFKMCFEF